MMKMKRISVALVYAAFSLRSCSTWAQETPRPMPDDNSNDDNKESAVPPSYTSYLNSAPLLSPLTKLQLDLDRNRMMHRLAAHYFEFQNFWILFVPSIGITMLSGVMACLGDSAGLTHWISPELKAILSTSVGVLSIVSVFFQSVNKELDYSHRAKEHEGVAMELRILYDQIKFDELTLAREEEDSISLSETVKLYQEKYVQAMTGGTSPLPTSIYNAYELASSRMELYIFPPILGNSKDELAKTRVDWTSAMGIVNNEVFNAFGECWGWPMFMPQAEHVVIEAFESIYMLLRDGQQDGDKEDVRAKRRGAIGYNIYRLFLEQQRGIKLSNRQLLKEEEDLYPSQAKRKTECTASSE